MRASRTAGSSPFDRSLLDDAATVAASEKDVPIDLQRLVLEEPEVCPRSDSASSSSSIDNLDATAAGQYCAWTPERCKKSSSTGSSSSRPWRLRDLVLGRSHSDGKEKFVFLSPTEKYSSKKVKPAAVEKRKGRKPTEVDLASLHRRRQRPTVVVAAIQAGSHRIPGAQSDAAF